MRNTQTIPVLKDIADIFGEIVKSPDQVVENLNKIAAAHALSEEAKENAEKAYAAIAAHPIHLEELAKRKAEIDSLVEEQKNLKKDVEDKLTALVERAAALNALQEDLNDRGKKLDDGYAQLKGHQEAHNAQVAAHIERVNKFNEYEAGLKARAANIRAQTEGL